MLCLSVVLPCLSLSVRLSESFLGCWVRSVSTEAEVCTWRNSILMQSRMCGHSYLKDLVAKAVIFLTNWLTVYTHSVLCNSVRFPLHNVPSSLSPLQHSPTLQNTLPKAGKKRSCEHCSIYSNSIVIIASIIVTRCLQLSAWYFYLFQNFGWKWLYIGLCLCTTWIAILVSSCLLPLVNIMWKWGIFLH